MPGIIIQWYVQILLRSPDEFHQPLLQTNLTTPLHTKISMHNEMHYYNRVSIGLYSRSVAQKCCQKLHWGYNHPTQFRGQMLMNYT